MAEDEYDYMSDNILAHCTQAKRRIITTILQEKIKNICGPEGSEVKIILWAKVFFIFYKYLFFFLFHVISTACLE